MTAKEGFILTIDGCPFAFATGDIDLTGGLPAISDWPTGITTGSILLGALDNQLGSWKEELKPLEGDLDAAGMTFKINPVRATINGATRVASDYLFSRTNQSTCRIQADVSETATTILLGEPSGIFVGTNFVVWINKEAILCSSRTGNTLNVSQRGYYGTKAQAHYTDISRNYYPEVWADWMGPSLRRTTLWRCVGAGGTADNWFVMRRLVTNRTPRLNTSNPAIWELQCEHYYTKWKQQNFNTRNYYSARMTGYHNRFLGVGVTADGISPMYLFPTHPNFFTDENDTVTRVYTDIVSALTAAVSKLKLKLFTDLGISYDRMEMSITGNPASGKLRFTCRIQGVTSLRAFLLVGGQHTYQNGSNGTSGIPEAICEIDFPTIANYVNGENDSIETDGIKYGYLHVNNFDNLPSTYFYSGSVDTCINTDVLHADFEDTKQKAWFFPSGNLETSPVVKIKGQAEVKPLKATSPDFGNLIQSTNPVEFKLSRMLRSAHWVDGLRYGIIEGYGDSRNWDWSNYENIKRAVPNALDTAVDWMVDGSVTFRQPIEEHCKFSACCPSITTDGKLTIVPMKAPTLLDTPTATLSYNDFLDKPTYDTTADVVVNAAKVNSDLFKEFVINEPKSRGLYESGNTIELDITGFSNEFEIASHPETLTSIITSRYFSMYSRPYSVATVKVSLYWYNRISLGDIISLTDWVIPDGTGNRSISAQKAFVTGRTIDAMKGAITYSLIIFPPSNGSGYSPCVRVGWVEDSLTVGIVGDYISTGAANGITDYAGSNLPEYIGTANDFGIGKFSAGDRVQFIIRNDTFYGTASYIIDAVDIVNKLITFTVPLSVDVTDAIASGWVIDIRYDLYDTSGLATSQKSYAWAGNHATGYIGASTDRVQQFKR